MDVFPSSSYLIDNYNKIDWSYSDDTKPYWVLYDSEVFKYVKKNGGKSITIISCRDEKKHPSVGKCQFFLNEMITKVIKHAPTKKETKTESNDQALDELIVLFEAYKIKRNPVIKDAIVKVAHDI